MNDRKWRNQKATHTTAMFLPRWPLDSNQAETAMENHYPWMADSLAVSDYGCEKVI